MLFRKFRERDRRWNHKSGYCQGIFCFLTLCLIWDDLYLRNKYILLVSYSLSELAKQVRIKGSYFALPP